MIEILVWLLIFALTFAVITTALSIRKQRRIDRKRDEQELKRQVMSNHTMNPDKYIIGPDERIVSTVSAVNELKEEMDNEKIIHPPEESSLVTDEGVAIEASKRAAESMRTLENEVVIPLNDKERAMKMMKDVARKKKEHQPFYKDDKKKDWE